MISSSPRCTNGAAGRALTRRRISSAGRRALSAERRRLRALGEATRNAPRRANGSRRQPSASTTEAAAPARAPTIAIRRRCLNHRLRDRAVTRARDRDARAQARPRRACRPAAAPCGLRRQIRGHRHIKRHGHAAHRPPQHHALARELDEPHAIVGRVSATAKRTGKAKGSSRKTRLDRAGASPPP